jgi:diguanylate cyclase (GGDEF)-like protein
MERKLDPLAKRRLSDISFVIDKDLNVKSGNRSFLRLIHKTDFNINLSYILEDSDIKNFKFFLSNFDERFPKRNFLASIKPFENYISCIFTISKQGEFFNVIIEELSYSRQLLDKALMESRELTALMQNFDSYYFLFDGNKYTLKNTKDLNTIFEGSQENFKKYITNTFKINVHNEDSLAQLSAMFENIENFSAGKYYTFLQIDKKIFTVHTLKTSTRHNSLIVASINLHKENEPVMNTYSESRDGLTGLYNKKAITELAIKKINEEKSPCSLIILDADKFKECNDSYGHIFGDRVLVSIANCINDAIKGRGIAGRIGGDEFLILLDVTDEDDIHQIARNIRTGIQWSITNVDPESVVTCSMGIAKFPVNAQNYEDLFELADKSLYIAKYRGRNTYILYSPELHDKILIENKQIDDRVTSGKFFFDCVNLELEILNKIQKLDGSKKEAVYEVLNLMISYLQISKITIYDKDFKLLYLAGVDEVNSREDYVKRTSNYFKLFNEYSFLHLDNTNVLNSIDGDRYDLYRFTNISSTIEVLVKDKNCGNLLICYDLYKPARTFKKDKITFALLIARKLSEIL